jgi:hypothetical protein
MKQKLFLPTLLCLVLFATAAFGQRVKINSQSATGTFRVSATAAEVIDAKYSIRPAAPDNIVLIIAPKYGQFTLNAHIIDIKGREVAKIPSEQVTQRYANSINISKLAPGNYFIEILNGGNNGYSIPFTVSPKTAAAPSSAVHSATVKAKQ